MVQIKMLNELPKLRYVDKNIHVQYIAQQTTLQCILVKTTKCPSYM